MPNAPSTLCGFPTVTQGSAGLPMSLRACRTCTCSRSYFQSCPAWFQFSWLTYQARYVRVQVPRRAMHASCESPWHSLAKQPPLGALLPPQGCLSGACCSYHEVARRAELQGLIGYLYIRWCFHIPLPCFHGARSALGRRPSPPHFCRV